MAINHFSKIKNRIILPFSDPTSSDLLNTPCDEQWSQSVSFSTGKEPLSQGEEPGRFHCPFPNCAVTDKCLSMCSYEGLQAAMRVSRQLMIAGGRRVYFRGPGTGKLSMFLEATFPPIKHKCNPPPDMHTYMHT